jgi:hypothetical protein
MVRVPLPYRGVAVLLLAASTAVGQTPEPPVELFSLDSVSPSPPDFLRQFSADPRHPLLSLMVDGELASLDAAPASQEAIKIKPQPKSSSTAPAAESSDGVIVDDGQLGGLGSGLLDGGLGGGVLGGGLGAGGLGDGLLGGGLGGGCGLGTMCSMGTNMMPFACAQPPCGCRKCQRKCHKHGGGCGHGGGYGNPYMNWPTCPAWCFYGAPLEPCGQGRCGRRCGHKHCGGGAGYGNCGGYGYGYGGGYGGGWNMMGEGFMDGGCGFGGGCMPPQSCGHKCHRRHNRCGGGGGYGCAYGGGYGGGWGMGSGGYMDGGWGMGGGYCGCYMPQQSCGHRCHRGHGCSNYGGGYGYGGGYLCPGWDGYGGGCGRRHCGGRCHRGCQQPYYPMMMPCMGGMMSGMGMMSDMGMMSGMGMMSDMGMTSDVGTMSGTGWESSLGAGGMLGGDCGCGNTMLVGAIN